MLLKNIFGDFPPNSIVTGFRFLDAYCIINCPVVVSPVKATLSTRGLDARGFPASGPKPCSTLNTPGGNKWAIFSAKNVAEAGVCSAGFKITQFPAASAPATFQANISNGKFQGIIWATTPRGSLMISERVFSLSSVAEPSSARITDAKYLK